MTKAISWGIKIGLLVWLAVWLANRPGHVHIVWAQWNIDTTIGFAVALVIILCVLSVIITNSWHRLNNLPSLLSKYWSKRQQERGYDVLTHALVAIASGDQKAAKRMTGKAHELLENDTVSTLFAAQASQLAGDHEAAVEYFQKLLDKPNTAFLGLLGLMRHAKEQRLFAEALEYAKRALILQPASTVLLKEIFSLQLNLRAFEDGLETLQQLKNLDAISKDEAGQRGAEMHWALAEAALKEENLSKAEKHGSAAYSAMPETGVHLFVRVLEQQNKARKAMGLIEKHWHEIANSEMAAAYIRMSKPKNNLDKARSMEVLCARDMDNPVTILLLVDALVDAEIWGKARQNMELYKEKVGTENRHYFRMMARIEREENSDEEAAQGWLNKMAEHEAQFTRR
ncbi:MAG: hypothetical protein K0U39_04290 [Alphaproteobacteria bacterium]|nr:hypothetical protein [Alphaproteobacteria bacterium]